MAEYPKGRPRFFANYVIRKMFKSCAAQELGPIASLLVIAIAHTEDAKRYSNYVTYYNDQLLPILGIRKWEALDRARQRAVKAGWLHYECPGKHQAGRYWILLPEHFKSLDDSPMDEELYPANGDNEGDKTGISGGIRWGQVGVQPGDIGGDVGGELSSLPLPLPVPVQDSLRSSSETKQKRSKAKTIQASDIELPPSLDTPAVRSAVEAWLAYKRARGQPYKTGGHLARTITELGSAQAIVDAINWSMGQNYAGIFARTKHGRPERDQNGSSLLYDPNATSDLV